MIQTEVKELGTHEYQVHVNVPQSEYDRIHTEVLQKLTREAKLSDSGSGMTPTEVLKQMFGTKLHDDTVSKLLKTHYIKAIESSGLTPAIQPELDVPDLQTGKDFEFSIKIITWPKVSLGDLSKLSFIETTIEVDDRAVQSAIDQMIESQVAYRQDNKSKLEKGDQAHIDFVGTIDGEKFEGGKGENVPLIIGEENFIPGFEDQLIGNAAGENVTIDVTFPENYQATHLAGKTASFATVVLSVGKPETADNESALAKMLNFENKDALRADVEGRLDYEAEQASYLSTREAALDALLATHTIELPATLVEQDMVEIAEHVIEDMKQRGVEVKREMLSDEAFKDEIKKRSERGLRLSLLLQAIHEIEALSVDDAEIDAEVDAEIDRQAQQYPEDEHEQFKSWLKAQEEQMDAMREGLYEHKYIGYIVSQATTTAASKALSVWQKEQQEKEQESA